MKSKNVVKINKNCNMSMMGHPRVTIGYLWSTVGYLRAAIDHLHLIVLVTNDIKHQFENREG